MLRRDLIRLHVRHGEVRGRFGHHRRRRRRGSRRRRRLLRLHRLHWRLAARRLRLPEPAHRRRTVLPSLRGRPLPYALPCPGRRRAVLRGRRALIPRLRAVRRRRRRRRGRRGPLGGGGGADAEGSNDADAATVAVGGGGGVDVDALGGPGIIGAPYPLEGGGGAAVDAGEKGAGAPYAPPVPGTPRGDADAADAAPPYADCTGAELYAS